MKKINLAEQTISPSELKKLSKWILKEQKLTKGNLNLKFEKKFSEWLGVKYSVFVNSGSSANLLIAQSLLESNFLKNKTVVIPSVSWSTTVAPFVQLGYDVILCDCDTQNLGLDLNHLRKIIKFNKPSLVVLCHVLGHANHLDEIKKLCKQNKILLVEDTCESIGSSLYNIKLGNHGIASSFSFYYGHHISTIEGGMVSTNDKKFYNLLCSIRSHGWSRDMLEMNKQSLAEKYNKTDFDKFYTFYNFGFNIRSTEINAFLGISQLNKINKIIYKRSENFKLYNNYLKDYWHQKSLTKPLSSFAYGTFISNVNETYAHLKKNNIECRPLICGSIGLQPFWINKFGKTNLKNADFVSTNGIYLPNHYNLTKNDIQFVCSKFKEVAIPFFPFK